MHLKIAMLYFPFVDDTNILWEIVNLEKITAYNKKNFFSYDGTYSLQITRLNFACITGRK